VNIYYRPKPYRNLNRLDKQKLTTSTSSCSFSTNKTDCWR